MPIEISKGFLKSTKVTINNGSKILTLTDNVDCSFIASGTAIFLNNGTVLLEAIKGTPANGSGISQITLRETFTGTSLVDTGMIAFNTIEGLRDAIARVRELVSSEVTNAVSQFSNFLTETSNSLAMSIDGNDIIVKPYGYFEPFVTQKLSTLDSNVLSNTNSLGETIAALASLDLRVVTNKNNLTTTTSKANANKIALDLLITRLAVKDSEVTQILARLDGLDNSIVNTNNRIDTTNISVTAAKSLADTNVLDIAALSQRIDNQSVGGTIAFSLDSQKLGGFLATDYARFSTSNVFTSNNAFNGGIETNKQFVSKVSSGTAPFSVVSNTIVPNLNASLLGGVPQSSFLRKPNNHVTNNSTYYLTWDNGGGDLYTSDADLQYNPAQKRIKTGKFESTVPNGTAPFVVASSEKVVNLNADMVDGITSDKLARRDTVNTFDMAQTFSKVVSLGSGVDGGITWEDGKHIMTNNDGGGSFNFRLGNQFNGTHKATTANSTPFHQVWADDQADGYGSHKFTVGSSSGYAIGDPVVFRNMFEYNNTWVKLFYEGSQKLVTTSNGVTVTGDVIATNFTGLASDSSKLGGLASSAFGKLATSNTWTTDNVFNRIRANTITTAVGQQLILCAGESENKVSGQTNEYVYVNSESGLSINTPDAAHSNWQTGYTVDTATIKGGSISLAGNLVWHEGNDGNFGKLDTSQTWTGLNKISGGLVIGTNSISSTFNNGKAISLGDSDTGIRQNGDGVLELWSNNTVVADLRNTKIKLNKPVDINGYLNTDGFSSARTNSTANTTFNANFIDANFSGSDALDADRTKTGLFIDVDSSASGGDTSNEHRIYGLYTSVKAIGDSDLVYGNYGNVEAEHSVGQISELRGAYNYALSDVRAGGTVVNVQGSSNFAIQASTSSGNTNNLYGSYNKALKAANNTTATATGVYAEVEVDTGILSNAYAVRAYIDTDGGSISNSYLFYGDYQGNLPTNAYGIYITDAVLNHFGGNVRTNTQFESKVSTGTAPLIVASTTKVVNLNADLLDGYNHSIFGKLADSQTWADTQYFTKTPYFNNNNIIIKGSSPRITYDEDGIGQKYTTLVDADKWSVRYNNGIKFSVDGSTGGEITSNGMHRFQSEVYNDHIKVTRSTQDWRITPSVDGSLDFLQTNVLGFNRVDFPNISSAGTIFEGGIELKDKYLGLSSLNYNSSTTFATAWTAVEEFKDWVSSGDADTSAYDTVTDSIATGFINSIIGRFNIVVAAKANIGYLSANAISVGLNNNALNENPFFTKTGLVAAASNNEALGWPYKHSHVTYGKVLTDGQIGNVCMQVISGGNHTIMSDRIKIDPHKTYQISLWVRRVGTVSRNQYFLCRFTDEASVQRPTGGTGWGGTGSYNYWGRVNQTVGTAWTKYTINISSNPQAGDVSSATPPTGSEYVQIGMLANHNGTGTQTIQYQDYRIEEMTTATTIVDGTITADKLNVNSIFAEEIEATGTITGGTFVGGTFKTSIETSVERTILDADGLKYYSASKGYPSVILGESGTENNELLQLGDFGGNDHLGRAISSASTHSGAGANHSFVNKGTSAVIGAYNNAPEGETYIRTSNNAITASNMGGGAVIRATSYGSGVAGVFTSVSNHAAQFEGDVTKAPFTVNSSVLVNNLNADLFDGLNSSKFVRSDQDDAISGHTTWADSKDVRLGTSHDMRLLHDGSNSYIRNYTGHLYMRSYAHGKNLNFQVENSSGTVQTPLLVRGDATSTYVELRAADVWRLRSTTAGASINGAINLSATTGTAPLVVASSTKVSNLHADLLDGYHASTTRTLKNTIPVRDNNGYLNVGWINTTSGATTNASSDYYVNTNDGYIRKKTKALVQAELVTTTRLAAIAPNVVAVVKGRVVTDCNHADFRVSGMYGFQGNPANGTGESYGSMIVAHNSDTGLQISGGHTNDDLYFRGWSGNGSTYQPWRKILHNANFHSYVTAAYIKTHITSAYVKGIATAAYVKGFIDTTYIRTQVNKTHVDSLNVNAGTLDNLDSTKFLRSDATQTQTNIINLRGHLVTEDAYRNRGVFGTYVSTKTNQIWSMGTGYKSSATGVNFGNLYGLAYKHTNNTTGGTMAGGHMAVWCENGTPKVAMGSNLWAKGLIYEQSQLLSARYLGKTAKAASATTADVAANSGQLNGFSSSESATARKIVLRDTAGDVHARLIRTNYADQSTMSGGLMFRTNNSTDNYTRVCTSSSAVRGWLSVQTTGQADVKYARKDGWTRVGNFNGTDTNRTISSSLMKGKEIYIVCSDISGDDEISTAYGYVPNTSGFSTTVQFYLAVGASDYFYWKYNTGVCNVVGDLEIRQVWTRDRNFFPDVGTITNV